MPSLWPFTPTHPPPPLMSTLSGCSIQLLQQRNKQTKQPGVVRPPLGTGSEKEAPCIDVRMIITERKRKDLTEWIELLIEWEEKKVTWQNPDQWLRQWDKHLLGHCAWDGGLDLTLLSHTVNRPGRVGSVTRGRCVRNDPCVRNCGSLH